MSRLRAIFRWLSVWFAFTVAQLVAGTLLGELIWIVVGTLACARRDTGRLALDGAWIGFRYSGVWAGGVAIILCFVKARTGFSFCAWWRRRSGPK